MRERLIGVYSKRGIMWRRRRKKYALQHLKDTAVKILFVPRDLLTQLFRILMKNVVTNQQLTLTAILLLLCVITVPTSIYAMIRGIFWVS